ncbi:hypothetical protein D3C77_235590 [compost metagenome]
MGEDVVNLLDVFGTQLVLVLALGVFAIGIDKQHLIAQRIGLAFVKHQHTGGDAGAVEQAGRQADDGFKMIIFDQ